MRRNLVIVRAGRDSRHPEWLAGASLRNFDVMVSHYASDAVLDEREADYVELVPGMKWPRLHRLWTERRDWFLGYDACWFPDDDLSCDGANVSRMFDVFHAHGLWLAQPALAPGSYVAHAITRRASGHTLRFTNFAEVMCPLFERSALERLAYTFAQSVSGWGLDYLWPHLLGYPKNRIAILDATPVVHTRPQGTGANYARCTDLGVRPSSEARRILKRHGLAKPKLETYDSVAALEG